MRGLFRLLCGCAFLALSLGTALHLTVKDGWQPLAVIFYGLPLPVLMAGWAGLGIILPFKSALSRLSLLLGVGCAAMWLVPVFNKASAPAPTSVGLKTMFWNMAHHELPSEGLAKLVEKEKPDVAAFVEVGLLYGDPNPLLNAPPAGYQMFRNPSGAIAIIVRGAVKEVRRTQLPVGTKFMEFLVTVDGIDWHVFIVDVLSKPNVERQSSLAAVLIQAKGRERTIVMGDFNTPITSIWFEPWKISFKHAYETAGKGLEETWPRWLPMLTIDHIWVSPDVAPVSFHKRWDGSSDHAALFSELELSPLSASPTPQVPVPSVQGGR